MTSLQISMLTGSLGTLIFILIAAKKTNMNIRYTVVWIFWACIIIVLAIFPELIDILERILSIAMPVNALFLVFIFLLYLLCFYLFIMLSKQNEQIKSLTYEIAELKRKEKEDKDK